MLRVATLGVDRGGERFRVLDAGAKPLLADLRSSARDRSSPLSIASSRICESRPASSLRSSR